MAQGIFVERAPRDVVPRAPRRDAISAALPGHFSLNESQTRPAPHSGPTRVGAFAPWGTGHHSNIAGDPIDHTPGAAPPSIHILTGHILGTSYPLLSPLIRRLIGLNCCFLDARTARHHLPKVMPSARSTLTGDNYPMIGTWAGRMKIMATQKVSVTLETAAIERARRTAGPRWLVSNGWSVLTEKC